MTRESCITYPPTSISIVIRAALVEICAGAPDANCAAAILNQFIYWTDTKIEHAKQAKYHNAAAIADGELPTQDDSLWIYKKSEEMQEELLHLFGRNKIVDNTVWLVSAGYLHSRRNPIYRWDKTLQYHLDIDTVQSRIHALREFNFKLSIVQNQTLDSSKIIIRELEINQAIPEITTETTTKKKASSAAQDVSHRKAKTTTTPKSILNPMMESIVAAMQWDRDILTDATWSTVRTAAKQLIAVGVATDEVVHLKRECDVRQFRGYGPMALCKVVTDVLPRIRRAASAEIADTPTNPDELQRELEAELARNLNYGALMTGGGK